MAIRDMFCAVRSSSAEKFCAGIKVMIYRTYGTTGTKVSAVGFGGMRFENDLDAAAELVKAGYDVGINYFDTAPGYPNSEQIFGTAFKEMNKTRKDRPFYVSTKSMKTNADEIRRDLETSLKRMNLDYIDFYHVWCVLSLQAYYQRKAGGVLATFEKLRDEGLIKHICVSTHMTGPEVGEILADYPFEGVLLGYSVMNFAYREAGLDAAAAKKCGVVVMNPLGGGIIPQHPQRFEFAKTRPEETAVEAALRFLLNDPRITIALVGFSNEKQLAEALDAVAGYKPIPTETVQKIRSGLQQAFNRLCTSCLYCDNCPQQIPVPKLMEAYNWLMLTGKEMELINRLRWHWGFELEKEEPWPECTECGECESACTQKLPIPQRIKEMLAGVEKFRKEQAQQKK